MRATRERQSARLWARGLAVILLASILAASSVPGTGTGLSQTVAGISTVPSKGVPRG